MTSSPLYRISYFALNKRLAFFTFNFPTKILRLNLMHFCFTLLTNSINVYSPPSLPPSPLLLIIQ